MHRALKLHHHKHTGKLIHHRHTSYWVLILLVVISAGITMVIDRSVRADTLTLSATVPAPIPSGAPVFTSPASGSTTTSANVTFTGTCPVIVPAVIVAIYRTSELLGSGVCNTGGEFSINATINIGPQTLIAQVVTITGQTGESSAPLIITYTPTTVIPGTPVPLPVIKTPTTPPTDSGQALVSPLQIHLERPVITYRAGLATTLRASFSGGTLPYSIAIQWGDGQKLVRTVDNHAVMDFTHIYGNINVKNLFVTVSDADGHSLTRSYAVVNVAPSTPLPAFSIASILDAVAPSTLHISLLVYSLLIVGLSFLWHFEHTHFRRKVGVPMHYHWQKNTRHKR